MKHPRLSLAVLCAIALLTGCSAKSNPGIIPGPVSAQFSSAGTLRGLHPSGLNILYAFPTTSDGIYPLAPYFASDGKIYGTTFNLGGDHRVQDGNFYVLTPSSSGYTERRLFHFWRGSRLGVSPSPISRDASGNFWGMASRGLFKLSDQGTRGWVGTLVYPCLRSNYPHEGVTTIGSDVYFACNANSTIYKVSPSGSSYTATVLHTFPAGASPSGVLSMDSSGALYGITSTGGSSYSGTVFKLTPSGGTYTETDLHQFSGAADGSFPQDGVTLGAGGALYGTTTYDGDLSDGTVYELVPGGPSRYTYAVIDDIPNGAEPVGPPIQDGSGRLYFSTQFSSVGGYGGAFFKLTFSGARYTESTVYVLPGLPGPDSPEPGLIRDSAGDIFVATESGGVNSGSCARYGGCGTIIEITP